MDDIESWYLDRFLKMLSLAQNDPDSYYYRFTQMPIGEVEALPIRSGPVSISQIYKIILNQPEIVQKWFFIKARTMKSMKFT